MRRPLSVREAGGLLRAAALVALVAGAAGSLALMLWVGRRNPSVAVMGFFVVWVIAPFVALLFADRVSKRWTPASRTRLHLVMLVVSLASVALYADVVLRPPRSVPAFRFLVVPMVSWVVIALAGPLAAAISNRRPL